VSTASTGSQAIIPDFKMPNDGQTYIEQVRNRCHDLIQCGIWSGLHIQMLNQWWNNFRTDVEHYFAACLLDSVIYRSDEQTLALMRQLVQRSLPDFGRSTNGITDWEERLQATPFDTRIRLVPVIPHGSAQGKSAHLILRLFEKRLKVQKHLLAKAEDVASLIASGIEAIVFVDDLLGTGTQFVHDFALPYKLDQIKTRTPLIYAPLVAHEDGIKFILSMLPNFFVTSAENLAGAHAIFGATGVAFADGINSRQSAWKLYSDILSSRGIVLDGSARRGFGELELAYFFQHAAPDNNLPIFWWNETPSWKPLFYR